MSSATRIEQGAPRTIKGAAVLGAPLGVFTVVGTPPVLLELLAGLWLWRGQRRGGRLALLLLVLWRSWRPLD